MSEELSINPYYDKLSPILQTLPETPGVYQYFDKNGIIIYIGKAKNLKNRVLSYFRNDISHNSKTRLLVRKIYNIELVHVNTETEALLLECNLIKKHRPRYNILLKDDKSYPWIRITNEEFPKIFKTRNLIKDGSLYFGPYPSKRGIKELMDIIRLMFRYRTCNLKLSEESIKLCKFKSCLNYQIKLCNAPCIGEETKEDYNKTISIIKTMLKGDFSSLIKDLKQEMMLLAEELKFEQAQEIKERISLLENYQSKTSIVSSKINDVEVFAYTSGENSIFFNMMKVVGGMVVSSYSMEVVKKLEETDQEVFTSAIIQSRDKMQWTFKEIIVPEYLDLPDDYLIQTVPQMGEKKQLLELSLHNAKFSKIEKSKKATLLDPERHSKRILEQMRKDLRMKELPVQIDCFDNSNTQGTEPVAACVVFRNAKPSNREYKHYNIKTVVGPDDYASMQEVVYRRYSRLKAEGKPLPQLIVIDGGKGQLSSTVEVLTALEIIDKVTVIGIAERLEEIYFPNDPIPLHLDRRSETLKIIQQIRDEAHRFGITHHRSRRSKATFKTQLTDIEGIGEVTSRNLLLKFLSVKRISQASLEDLTACIGKSKAEVVYNYFRKDVIDSQI
ncbi:MAG: excinuclease ABC subunit UvrC [Bacteroidales bacterium]|nr:excinuclease ABC subunit UvrC [Bacteroidales bacterium]MDD4684220.1 excinuclease ABC subunit UvrC [Bacteroidales bacterium]